MQAFGFWDTLSNILVLLLWFRIWTDSTDRIVVFNPYLAPIGRAADTILAFVRSGFPAIPPRLAAGLCIFVVLLLRGLLVPADAAWCVSMGFERQALLTSAPRALLFSIISFAAFLFKIWGVSLIYVRTNAVPSDRTAAALHDLARPFTDLRIELRPLALLLVGMVIAALVDILGRVPEVGRPETLTAIINWRGGSFLIPAIQLAILAMAGWTQILLLLQYIMIMLIIGSWASLFMSSPGLMMFCKDWMDMLLGPLRKRPMRIGMFDLSPLVFFFALMIVHFLLLGILATCYQLLT